MDGYHAKGGFSRDPAATVGERDKTSARRSPYLDPLLRQCRCCWKRLRRIASLAGSQMLRRYKPRYCEQRGSVGPRQWNRSPRSASERPIRNSSNFGFSPQIQGGTQIKSIWIVGKNRHPKANSLKTLFGLRDLEAQHCRNAESPKRSGSYEINEPCRKRGTSSI